MTDKLFVGGLDFKTTSAVVQRHFERFGRVLEAKIVHDRVTQQSRGFGFVTMESVEAANAVIENLNGKELEGRTIRIEKASGDKSGFNRGPGGFPPRGGPRDFRRPPGPPRQEYGGYYDQRPYSYDRRPPQPHPYDDRRGYAQPSSYPPPAHYERRYERPEAPRGSEHEDTRGYDPRSTGYDSRGGYDRPAYDRRQAPSYDRRPDERARYDRRPAPGAYEDHRSDEKRSAYYDERRPAAAAPAGGYEERKYGYPEERRGYAYEQPAPSPSPPVEVAPQQEAAYDQQRYDYSGYTQPGYEQRGGHHDQYRYDDRKGQGEYESSGSYDRRAYEERRY